jgi:hypothetical protein
MVLSKVARTALLLAGLLVVFSARPVWPRSRECHDQRYGY